MRVLITGGAGFIGLHLATRLADNGIEVVALDSLSPQVHLDPAQAVRAFPGQVIAGDVRDAVAVRLAAAHCDAIVHLAAETGVAQSMTESVHYRQVNVEGTGVVAEAAARLDLPLVLASSRAVYGQGAFLCKTHGRRVGSPCCGAATPTASKETDQLIPISVYGETKVSAERILSELRPRDTRWTVVRPQNVVGPGQSPHNPYTGVLAAFSARLRTGLAPQVYGDGTQTRDFVDVRDVANALSALVLDPGATRMDDLITVNVGSGQRTSLMELAEVAVRAVDIALEPKLVNVAREGDIEHACADTELFESLGLPLPRVPLVDSVRAFLFSAWQAPAVDPAIWDAVVDAPGGN